MFCRWIFTALWMSFKNVLTVVQLMPGQHLVSIVIPSSYLNSQRCVSERFSRDFCSHTLIRSPKQQLSSEILKNNHNLFIIIFPGLLFGRKTTSPRMETEQRLQARRQLVACVPAGLRAAAGPGLHAALHRAFDIIQTPQLNKQVY